MKNQITACIDGSPIATSVCDSAAWASKLLDAPLKFLHVLEKSQMILRDDFSGAIGLGSREQLLMELTQLDEQRNKLAMEHGKHILADAKKRAQDEGAVEVTGEQRHDSLLSALLEIEASTRLYVIGRLGEGHDVKKQAIGSHIESVVRAIQTPILMATGNFSVPANYMLAYDGSETAQKAIERICKSPLLRDIPGHVVTVGEDNANNLEKLNQATALLRDSGHQVESHLLQGAVVETLLAFKNQHNIQLKVMGAYGHSRIREFFVGSNTTKMLASSTVPVLILR